MDVFVKLRESLPARRLGSGCTADACSRASSRGRGCAAALRAEAMLAALVPDLCPAVPVRPMQGEGRLG